MRPLMIGVCSASALLAITASGPAATAEKAQTTSVLKTELRGEENMDANIVRFDVEAGWETERHIHPGHVFVYVTEGTVEIDVEGTEPRTISAGEAFYEMPDKPMVARTASADEGAKFVVFQVGPTDEPLMEALQE